MNPGDRITRKVAAFAWLKGALAGHIYVREWHERDEGRGGETVVISEPIEVELVAMPADKQLAVRLRTLKARENRINEEFSRELRLIENERQSLLALPAARTRS